MGRQLRFLLIVGGVLASLIALVVVLSQQKKAIQQAQLQQNLREAGFGGAPNLESAPRARFSSEVFDVGVVTPFDQVSRPLRVQNHGRTPLKVKVLDQGCSCVAVTIGEEKIAPGQSGVVEITFTAPEEEKAVDHTVLLSTNDPLQKQVSISVRGEVRRTVWTEPRELNFLGLLPKEAREQELRVFANWPEGCEVAELHGLPEGFEVVQEPLAEDDLSQSKARSGRLLRIKIPADWQGSLFAPLRFNVLRLGSSESVAKSVRVQATRKGRLSLSHDRLNTLGEFEIGHVPWGTGREFTLFLEARGENKELALERVEATPAFLRVALEPGVNAATSGLYRLRFAIPADAPEGSYAGVRRAKVTLHFNDSEYPAVTFHPEFHITRE